MGAEDVYKRQAWIRMAAGRGRFPDGGEALFRSGANAAITGDMLTTTGTSVAGDMEMRCV